MQYSQLGHADIKVSKICLGTMTFGEQNSEHEAHQQLDYALARGINFIDTAEMYPVPPKQETQGCTEAYIGSWLHKRKCREQIILATKVAGPGMMEYLRGGVELSAKQIRQALQESLKRLNTDYIDLYQVHWPARNTNYFGQLGYQSNEEINTPIKETLEALHELVTSGQVRTLGISNETPWGMMQYLNLAENNNWPRIVSVQNPYNLLNRSYEVGLAEMSHRENVGLLAYSPLGFGILTGKYLKGKRPAGARITKFERFTRYNSAEASKATEKYVALAEEYNITPAQLALAYVNSRPFVTSNIIGATSMEQLRENIDSIDVMLSNDVIQRIEEIHQMIPNPSP